jgi:phage nucleotide-binding protein
LHQLKRVDKGELLDLCFIHSRKAVINFAHILKERIMKILSTKDIEVTGVKALIYGASGVGKTSLAKTLAHKKTCIISFENGLLSLKDVDIDVVNCCADEENKPIEDAAKIMKLSETLVWLQEKEQKEKYQNIFVDSLTEIARTMLKALEKKHAGSTNKFIVWNELADNMERLVRRLRDFTGYNVFFTALEEIVQNNDSSIAIPEFPGNATYPKVVAAFDEFFRMAVDKDCNRALFCQPQSGFHAKDRSGELLAVEKPCLQTVINKIMTKKKEEKKEQEVKKEIKK